MIYRLLGWLIGSDWERAAARVVRAFEEDER